jgi:hypothetical protein
MRFLLVLLVVAPLVGCGQSSGPTEPLEVVPAMYVNATQTLAELHDDDRVSLEFPPQGGHVLFVGARVRNLDDRGATLRGRLRSAQDDSIFAEEARTVSFFPLPEDPTSKIPDLASYSNVANLPVCPSYSSFDLYDQPFILEVIVTSLTSNRTGSARVRVVPSCLQGDPLAAAFCRCDCAANYVLGKCDH